MTIAICGAYVLSISKAVSGFGLLDIQMYKSASVIALQAEALLPVWNSSLANVSLKVNGIYLRNLNSSELTGYPTSGLYCLMPR